MLKKVTHNFLESFNFFLFPGFILIRYCQEFLRSASCSQTDRNRATFSPVVGLSSYIPNSLFKTSLSTLTHTKLRRVTLYVLSVRGAAAWYM